MLCVFFTFLILLTKMKNELFIHITRGTDSGNVRSQENMLCTHLSHSKCNYMIVLCTYVPFFWKSFSFKHQRPTKQPSAQPSNYEYKMMCVRSLPPFHLFVLPLISLLLMLPSRKPTTFLSFFSLLISLRQLFFPFVVDHTDFQFKKLREKMKRVNDNKNNGKSMAKAQVQMRLFWDENISFGNTSSPLSADKRA